MKVRRKVDGYQSLGLKPFGLIFFVESFRRSGITGALGYIEYTGVLGYFIGLLGIVFTAEFGLLWLVSVLWGFGLLLRWLIQKKLITKELKTI